MDAEMLPILALRRDASAHGWRCTGLNSEGTYFYRRVDEDGKHEAFVSIKRVPGVKWYRDITVWVESTDGRLWFQHCGIAQTVGMLRAYSGYRGRVSA